MPPPWGVKSQDTLAKEHVSSASGNACPIGLVLQAADAVGGRPVPCPWIRTDVSCRDLGGGKRREAAWRFEVSSASVVR